MSVIAITVNDQQLVLTNTPLISAGGIRENYVDFTFSDEWDGFTRIGVFYHSDDPETKYQSVVDENGLCLIPHEVTARKGTLFICVNGFNQDEVVLTSQILRYIIVSGVYLDSEPSSPEIYETFIEDLNNTVQAISDARTEIAAVAASLTQIRQELITYADDLAHEIDVRLSGHWHTEIVPSSDIPANGSVQQYVFGGYTYGSTDLFIVACNGLIMDQTEYMIREGSQTGYIEFKCSNQHGIKAGSIVTVDIMRA